MLCLACHDERNAVPIGPHARVRGRGDIPCLGCHDPHGEPVDRHLLKTRHSATPGDPNGCLSCHEPKRKSRKRSALPGTHGHPVSGQIMDDGERLECGSCHDSHAPSGPTSELCLTCHNEERQAHKRGGHGRAECLDCHPAHRKEPSADVSLQPRNPASLRCLACHGAPSVDERAPLVHDYEHPAPIFLPDGRRWTPLGGLPLYGPDGEPLPPNENGDLTCASCHLVHGPTATGTGDSLRRSDWRDGCAACHESDTLLMYRYFHQPDRRKRLGVTR
jgi:hypothetical protein